MPAPIAATAAEPAARTAPPVPRVLAVAKSRPVRRILATLLAGQGVARLEEAEDGEAGLVALNLCRPHLVLIDHDLDRDPLTGGLALVRRIAALDLARPPALILLAPTGLTWLATGARRAGCAAVLPKPVTASSLARRLAALHRPGDCIELQRSA